MCTLKCTYRNNIHHFTDYIKYMLKPLTERQKQILEYIENFIKDHGYSPTFEEIREHFSFASINSVQKHISALVKKRYLSKEEHINRGISLMPEETGAVEIPLVGSIAAGEPIESIEEETITVPSNMIKSNHNYYALRVRGDSMTRDGMNGILNEDIIIIKQQNDIDYDGQIAVILNSRWEASLKHVSKLNGSDKLKLTSDNVSYKPMYWSKSNSKIQGIYVGSLRSINF